MWRPCEDDKQVQNYVERAEEIVVDGIILHKQCARVWTGFIWFKTESSGELLGTGQ